MRGQQAQHDRIAQCTDKMANQAACFNTLSKHEHKSKMATHLGTQAKAVAVAEARAGVVEHARAVHPAQEVVRCRLVLCSSRQQ